MAFRRSEIHNLLYVSSLCRHISTALITGKRASEKNRAHSRYVDVCSGQNIFCSGRTQRVEFGVFVLPIDSEKLVDFKNLVELYFE